MLTFYRAGLALEGAIRTLPIYLNGTACPTQGSKTDPPQTILLHCDVPTLLTWQVSLAGIVISLKKLLSQGQCHTPEHLQQSQPGLTANHSRGQPHTLACPHQSQRSHNRRAHAAHTRGSWSTWLWQPEGSWSGSHRSPST